MQSNKIELQKLLLPPLLMFCPGFLPGEDLALCLSVQTHKKCDFLKELYPSSAAMVSSKKFRVELDTFAIVFRLALGYWHGLMSHRQKTFPVHEMPHRQNTGDVTSHCQKEQICRILAFPCFLLLMLSHKKVIISSFGHVKTPKNLVMWQVRGKLFFALYLAMWRGFFLWCILIWSFACKLNCMDIVYKYSRYHLSKKAMKWSQKGCFFFFCLGLGLPLVRLLVYTFQVRHTKHFSLRNMGPQVLLWRHQKSSVWSNYTSVLFHKCVGWTGTGKSCQSRQRAQLRPIRWCTNPKHAPLVLWTGLHIECWLPHWWKWQVVHWNPVELETFALWRCHPLEELDPTSLLKLRILLLPLTSPKSL